MTTQNYEALHQRLDSIESHLQQSIKLQLGIRYLTFLLANFSIDNSDLPEGKKADLRKKLQERPT